MGIRETAFGRAPILIEKLIMALTLLENLRNSGLDFVFKGGTSLILLFKTLLRLYPLTSIFCYRMNAAWSPSYFKIRVWTIIVQTLIFAEAKCLLTDEKNLIS